MRDSVFQSDWRQSEARRRESYEHLFGNLKLTFLAWFVFEWAFSNLHTCFSSCTIGSWVLQDSFLSRSRRYATESLPVPSSFSWSTRAAVTGGFVLREPLRVGYRTAKLLSARP